MNKFEHFSRYFRFLLATSERDRKRVYAVRHHVFRGEFNYALGDDLRSDFERDRYDATSLLCLVEHRDTGRTAGCVRLIMPPRGVGPTLEALPLERFCGNSLKDLPLHPGRLPRDQVCEISRLAVPSLFRRRHGERRTPAGNVAEFAFPPEHTRTFPLIGVSLFLAATAMVGFVKRHHVYAMMEPKLARLLALNDLHFHQIGNIMEYYGKRAAFYIDQHRAVADMRPELADFYTFIQDELHPHFLSASEAAESSRLA